MSFYRVVTSLSNVFDLGGVFYWYSEKTLKVILLREQIYSLCCRPLMKQSTIDPAKWLTGTVNSELVH